VLITDFNGASPGLITITYGFPPVAGLELTLTPSVDGKALSAGAIGTVQWSCASSSSNMAAAQSLPVTVPGKPVPAGFAPADCR